MTDAELLALAHPALTRMPGGRYRPAPRAHAEATVAGKDVRRLVELGALRWVNRCHSAARLMEGARGLYA
jgi:hypothetical protein